VSSIYFVVLFVKNRANYDTSMNFSGDIHSVGVSDQNCPIGHLKIQDGDHFSRWPPFCIYKSGLVLN